MDGDVVVNKKVWRRAQGKYFLKKVGSERDESALPFENDSERRKEKGWRGSSDYSVPPRSQWRATDTHQGVRWQNALSINMLLRRNKTSLRASTLHANFISAGVQERHLCMQMRDLSISKLQLVPAKCVIMDVGGVCAGTLIQMCKALLSWSLPSNSKETLWDFQTTRKYSVLPRKREIDYLEFFLQKKKKNFWEIFWPKSREK